MHTWGQGLLSPFTVIRITLVGIGTALMNRCQVVRVRGSEDEMGISMHTDSKQQRSDCGIETCESHSEKCGVCREMFYSSCLSFPTLLQVLPVDTAYSGEAIHPTGLRRDLSKLTGSCWCRSM